MFLQRQMWGDGKAHGNDSDAGNSLVLLSMCHVSLCFIVTGCVMILQTRGQRYRQVRRAHSHNQHCAKLRCELGSVRPQSLGL